LFMSNDRKIAVFLDRDGTINLDTYHLSSPDELRLIPGSAQAIARLNQAGLPVVVVTNQSGLARGLFSHEDLQAVHLELDRLLEAQGAKVDAYYHCPHHPEGVVEHLAMECDCRKPGPGMLLKAAEDLGLQLGGSFMVGDRPGDVECALSTGLHAVRVLSGPDQTEDDKPAHKRAQDLAGAVDWILAQLENA
jgi:D-glycero-D-manno-heptose 1,7-bisphosphate phosphatase